MATITNVKKDAEAVLALGLQAAMEITLVVPSDARTLCGLTIVVPNEIGVPAKKCVFGGLIDIDGEWYGLVARHPFQDSAAFRQRSICVPGSNNEVKERLDEEDSSQAPITECVLLKVQVLVPSTVDAMGAATKDFDWALLDLSQLLNTDIWAKVLTLNRVDDQVIRRMDTSTDGDFEGMVTVVCGENRAIPGYLHPPSVSRDFRGSSFDVRSIVLKRPLPAGMAGAWVVWGDEFLLGFIVAVREESMCCYMIPISDVITEIKRRCKVTDVTLAGAWNA